VISKHDIANDCERSRVRPQGLSPVLGYADDAVVVVAVLRSVVRRAGAGPVARHWPGGDDGLAAVWRLCGLPGEPAR